MSGKKYVWKRKLFMEKSWKTSEEMWEYYLIYADAILTKGEIWRKLDFHTLVNFQDEELQSTYMS